MALTLGTLCGGPCHYRLRGPPIAPQELGCRCTGRDKRPSWEHAGSTPPGVFVLLIHHLFSCAYIHPLRPRDGLDELRTITCRFSKGRGTAATDGPPLDSTHLPTAGYFCKATPKAPHSRKGMELMRMMGMEGFTTCSGAARYVWAHTLLSGGCALSVLARPSSATTPAPCGPCPHQATAAYLRYLLR